MAPNGNPESIGQIVLRWAVAIFVMIALAAVGVNHAEIVRLDDKKVAKETYDQLCGRLDRIETKLDQLIMERYKP